MPKRRWDSIAAETAFRARLSELGAVLLEPEWLGAKTPHSVQCPKGHLSKSRPSDVIKGDGICKVCANRDPVTAEKQFRTRINALGGICLYENWQGVNKPHHVSCSIGHNCYPKPNSVQQGQGICKICGKNDPLESERIFKAIVAKHGGVCLYEYWQGVAMAHHVQCAFGHNCYPRPDHVQRGQGICAKCAHRIWDVFYIVADQAGNIKIGISSGNPRPRLADHARDGFTQVIRCYRNLPDRQALGTEQIARADLAAAGIRPIRGREYFPPEALPYVLAITEPGREPVSLAPVYEGNTK